MVVWCLRRVVDVIVSVVLLVHARNCRTLPNDWYVVCSTGSWGDASCSRGDVGGVADSWTFAMPAGHGFACMDGEDAQECTCRAGFREHRDRNILEQVVNKMDLEKKVCHEDGFLNSCRACLPSQQAR